MKGLSVERNIYLGTTIDGLPLHILHTSRAGAVRGPRPLGGVRYASNKDYTHHPGNKRKIYRVAIGSAPRRREQRGPGRVGGDNSISDTWTGDIPVFRSRAHWRAWVEYSQEVVGCFLWQFYSQTKYRIRHPTMGFKGGREF